MFLDGRGKFLLISMVRIIFWLRLFDRCYMSLKWDLSKNKHFICIVCFKNVEPILKQLSYTNGLSKYDIHHRYERKNSYFICFSSMLRKKLIVPSSIIHFHFINIFQVRLLPSTY